MRSAAVILTQHRRSRRSAIHRYERTLPPRQVESHGNPRRDKCIGCRNDARVSTRAHSVHARIVRRRHRPEVLIPRGFLPLVVH
jgi:hypothetical protein